MRCKNKLNESVETEVRRVVTLWEGTGRNLLR